MSYTIERKYPMFVICGSKSTGGSFNYTNVNSTQVGVKSGEKVEKWRERVAKGLAASSAYSNDSYTLDLGSPLKDTCVMGRGSTVPFLTSEFIGYPGAYWSNGSVAHLSVDMSTARSKALSKLYKKLESERSELNTYAVLAEFTDVLRQFGRPFSAIVDAFMRHENRLYFERRRLVGTKTWKSEKFSKIAADTWLETSFGLIPLFADAVGVAEAFGRFEHELEESPRLRDRMRSRASDSLTSVVNYGALSVTPFAYIDYFSVKEHRTSARAQYVVGLEGEVRAEFGSNKRLMELLGLEPRNLPLAAWEATPWSWLVDYWTNVQEILQAGATITSRVKWIVLSETTKSIVTYRSQLRRTGTATYKPVISFVSNRKAGSASGFGSPNSSSEQEALGNYGRLGTGDFRIVRTTFARTLPASLGVPPLILESPLGNLKKMANLGALVVSKQRDHKTWLS